MRVIFCLFLLILCHDIVQAQLHLPEKKDYRMAVLGCLRQLEPAPALYQYTHLNADLALWIGDNIYSDTKDDPEFIAQNYQKLASLPAFQQLKKKVPFLATWDDHDYGLNNSGGNYAIKAASKELFRTFWGLETQIPAEQEGIYYSQYRDIDGFRLQMVFLDPRYHRDPVRIDGKGDTLGEEQWAWLEKELRKPADLRLLISGYQILLTDESVSETWQRFPQAFSRLISTIREARAEGVVFLTGDQHYGEVLRKKGLLGYDAVELQFAGINQIEDEEFNPLRVAPVIKSKHSVAFIDLKLEADSDNVPFIDFLIYDAMSGQKELHYRLRLDELQYQFTEIGDHRFLEHTDFFIEHDYANLSIHYRMDTIEPTATDSVLSKPIRVEKSSIMHYALFDKSGKAVSSTRTVEFEKLKPIPALDLSSKKLQPGVRFEYIEGEWDSIPNWKDHHTLRTGISTDFKLESVNSRKDHFAIQWTGYVYVPETALYQWQTTSDDGSRLYLQSQLVVDNDGSHSKRLRTGVIALEKGWHPIKTAYFEDYAGEFLDVGYRKNGQSEWNSIKPDHLKYVSK